ncbi:MAG: hypothetical protein GY869_23115 [Planctomycetes bacterium]|nr:hypothetical protein [Planctomycetota bacterium]
MMNTNRVWLIVGGLVLLVGMIGCSRLFTNRNRVSLGFDEEMGEFLEVWKPAETNGRGTPGQWEMIDGAMVLSETENSGQTYNLLMKDGKMTAEVDISIKVQAREGVEDQGGGPIWRAVDADNYYICRWNPLEDNFRVYYVKEGKRTQITSADIVVDPKEWHTIRIIHKGNKITAVLDRDVVVLEIEDDTFSEGGKIGLWTKADAVTAFDDFMVTRTIRY